MVTQQIEVEGFTSTGSASDEVKRLRAKNPLWIEYAEKWNFYLSAYQGGDEFACRENLFKHTRETDEDFNDRVKRLHNLNYCEPLVDFFTNFIFSESIDRNGGTNTSWYMDFTKDVNKHGSDIDKFMRDVCDDMQIFGMVYVLVDSPVLPEGKVLTKQTEQDLKIRPYWVLIHPDEITDWDTDDFGNIVYAKRRQILRRIVAGKPREIERYTEFYPDRFIISELDVTSKRNVIYLGSKPIPNTLGEVPLRVARYKTSKRDQHMGLSFLRDFAYNNREIINMTSLLQEFLYRQAFNILAKEVDTYAPEKDEGEVGTANVIEVPKNAKMPQYISPPADPAKFIQEERTRIKNEMFMRAAQDTLNELFNGEKKSGFSQAQSFSKTVPFISSRADTLESLEVSLMELTMKKVGKSWNGKVKYKDRYELTNLTDALTQLMMIIKDLQIPSETFVKEELKRMVREYDGKLPADTLHKIMTEIDDMDFSKWSSVQKKALVGNQTSPAAQQKDKSTGTLDEVKAEAKVDNVAATKKLKDS